VKRYSKGAGSLALGADDPATLAKSLDDVELVINCVDAREPHLARETAARGMAYLDITAHVPFWRQVLALGEEARHPLPDFFGFISVEIEKDKAPVTVLTMVHGPFSLYYLF
jgi:hypothetical protein